MAPSWSMPGLVGGPPPLSTLETQHRLAPDPARSTTPCLRAGSGFACLGMFSGMSDYTDHEHPDHQLQDPFADGPEHAEGGDDGVVLDIDLTPEGRDNSAARRKVNRTLIRRAATKALALQKASKATRAGVAALLGVSDVEDVEALTVACLETSQQRAARPLRDLEALAGAVDMEAFVAAATMADNPAKFKQVWAVARLAGATLGEKPPANPIKAGAALANAASALTDTQLKSLRVSLELVG